MGENRWRQIRKGTKNGISLLNHVPTFRNNIIIIHKIIPEDVTKVDNRPKKGQPLTTKGKAQITSQVRVSQKLDNDNQPLSFQDLKARHPKRSKTK